MTREQAVVLTRYVKACCPQQAIDKYTPDAWHDLLGDLDLDTCKQATASVARRQPFVAPAEIRAEVRRAREDRLMRAVLPPPPAELADEPGRYRAALQAGVRRIADGFSLRRAIEGGPLEGEPPAEWVQARQALPQPAQTVPGARESAAEQAAISRAERERREDAS